MVGNTFKKKKDMSLGFLIVFDFITYVANSRGKEKVTETQKNNFLLLRGGVINKYFHLEGKKLRFVYMGTSSCLVSIYPS